ncbi:uncharacterized protein LOC130754968 [Actinidia eriantha]|uniref:uncharacterized protein LOC130754968 n=1 Tax=Actinidia eriantha TaxID=165200 RepID=UPI00258B020A|nr:uncharacterized protein LOC130754968 [Actinidia eriantha]
MGFTHILPSPNIRSPNPWSPTRSQTTPISPKTHLIFPFKNNHPREEIEHIMEKANEFPTMSDITEASKSQKIDLRLQSLGPFFRITAKSLETERELGRAEGVIRLWLGGKILHLDSIKLRRETLGMERSIFGIGLFIGAVAIRYGYECGCGKAELLAINDSDLYHSKLVRFYSRIGFKAVHEVTGSSMGDLAHMLVWGGVGTRMDATISDLLVKWCARFKPRN